MSLILLLIPSNGPLVKLVCHNFQCLKVLMTGRNLGHTSER